MIDEKRLIGQLASERTKAYIAYEMEREYWDKGYKDGLEFALKKINEQPKVGEWIPVEERLPEQSLNSVIGWDTYRERCVFVQYYMNEWILGNHESVNIVAWQPLPEPYKGEPK